MDAYNKQIIKTTTSNSHTDTSTSPYQNQPRLFASLCKLLLDEEGPQVGQLPGARHAEHDELDQDPSDHTRVGALGLIAELGFAFLHPTLVSS